LKRAHYDIRFCLFPHEGVRLRIAMVSPYSWAHPGGVNTHIRGLAGEMNRRGHRVTIIAPDRGGVPAGAEFISAGRSLPVPANGSVAHLALFPGAGGSVRRAAGEGGFDVVHVHEPLVPVVSTAAVMASRCRVVGTFHAAGEGRSLTYRLARALYRRALERLDYRIAVSESARSLASAHFPGSYDIIPNGVDIERFSPGGERPEGFPPAGRPVVLFVGRNERRKGLRVLLDAFPKVADRVPGCRLVVIGEGFTAGAVLPGIGEALRDRVTVPGYVGNEELPGYYGAADILCSPALGGESFGVVLIEAMASGTPVVASDIPGYRGVVEKTAGGRLFKTGEPDSLASTLVELLLDERLRGELAAQGLEGAAAFSWQVLGGRIEPCYRAD